MKRQTMIQHHGEDRARHHGAAAPVIYRTSLFTFPDSKSLLAHYQGDRRHYLYSRESNPTVRILEEKFARLEEADDALAFASGMGAISAAILTFLGSGDHLVLFSRSYGPTRALVRDIVGRLGVSVTSLEPDEVSRLDEHLNEATRLVYVESPASLTFDVLDLDEVAKVARRRGVTTVCDNSWATPIYQQPLPRGIDVVVHSGTKYVSGHSDVLLGLAAGTTAAIEKIRRVAPLLGACLSPADAALALRGLRTLPLRMERHRESALSLATKLEAHPRVKKVFHPALDSFPSHALWKRQFSGSSGLFSFVVSGDVCRVADRLKLFLLGPSWGGYESLALPVVATVSRSDGSSGPENELRPDLPDGLMRLSIGLEDPEDLWQDLEEALEAAG